MPFDSWKDVHAAAALADEEALAILAEQSEALAAQRASGQQDTARRSSAAAEFQRLHGRYQATRPDVFLDPEAAKVAEQRLIQLQKSRPDLLLEDAFEEMVAAVDESLGPGESRDYRSAISEMRRYRTEGRKDRAPADMGEELEQVRITPEDVDRSLAIAQMAEARKGQVNVFAQREQELRAKERGRFEAAMRARRGYVAEGSEE